MTRALAAREELSLQLPTAMAVSLVLHMLLLVVLQPVLPAEEPRISQRAIEVTLETATAPYATPAAEPTPDRDSLLLRASIDLRPLPSTSGAEAPATTQPQLENAVTLPETPPAVTTAELAPRPAAHAAKPSAAPPQQRAETDSYASQRQAQQDYVMQVVAQLSHLRFNAPTAPAERGRGVVVARLTVARNGGLVDLTLTRDSGAAQVDRNVLDTIRRVAPFPPLPKAVADNRFTFVVPINYTPAP